MKKYIFVGMISVLFGVQSMGASPELPPVYVCKPDKMSGKRYVFKFKPEFCKNQTHTRIGEQFSCYGTVSIVHHDLGRAPPSSTVTYDSLAKAQYIGEKSVTYHMGAYFGEIKDLTHKVYTADGRILNRHTVLWHVGDMQEVGNKTFECSYQSLKPQFS